MEFLFNTMVFGFPLIELIAVLILIINVGLLNFAKNKNLAYYNWHFGLVGSALYGFIFWQWQLFANAFLQIYYVVTSAIGIAKWRPGKAETEEGALQVQWMPLQIRLLSLGLVIGATSLMYFFLKTFTPNPTPYMDALIAALSLVSQWVMIRRYIEHWIGWIIVDILAIPLFWTQGLRPTAILYVIFLILSLNGLRIWLEAYHESKALPITDNPNIRVGASTLEEPTQGGFTPRTQPTIIEEARFS